MTCERCGAQIVVAEEAATGTRIALDTFLAVYHVVRDSPPLATRARGSRILALHRCVAPARPAAKPPPVAVEREPEPPW